MQARVARLVECCLPTGVDFGGRLEEKGGGRRRRRGPGWSQTGFSWAGVEKKPIPDGPFQVSARREQMSVKDRQKVETEDEEVGNAAKER